MAVEVTFKKTMWLMLVRSTYMNILRNKTNLCSHYKTNYWFITKKTRTSFYKAQWCKVANWHGTWRRTVWCSLYTRNGLSVCTALAMILPLQRVPTKSHAVAQSYWYYKIPLMVAGNMSHPYALWEHCTMHRASPHPNPTMLVITKIMVRTHNTPKWEK